MRNSFLLVTGGIVLMLMGCGEHQPVENDDDQPPPTAPDFGEENFFQGPYYYDDEGIHTFLLQSDRVISVLFNSDASNDQLRQVAAEFDLLLYPDLTRPANVDWEEEKHRTSLWVVPEGTEIFNYYTIFPRTEDTEELFGMHPLVRKSFPSFADQELLNRYFIDNRFYGQTSPEISREEIDDFNEFNGVVIIDEHTEDDIVEYLIHITHNSRFDTIEMANEYHESLYFLAAFPDFIIMELSE